MWRPFINHKNNLMTTNRKCWIIKTPGQNQTTELKELTQRRSSTEVFSSLKFACDSHPILNNHTSTIYKTEMNVERSFGHGPDWITIEHVKLNIK